MGRLGIQPQAFRRDDRLQSLDCHCRISRRNERSTVLWSKNDEPSPLKDSTSYRLLEKKIRIEEARSILLDLGTDRLGAPSEPQKTLIESIEDHDRLVGLCKKVAPFSTWDDLMTE